TRARAAPDAPRRRALPRVAGMPAPEELTVRTLGPCRHRSPIPEGKEEFVDERNRLLLPARRLELAPFVEACVEPPSFEPAGPRQRVFFAPATLGCGVVTCGGLCPGLNNVIR